MIEFSETFRLIGFEAPVDLETGFCTALYAAHAQSNQVFLAVPEIEGDRNSPIAFFEEVVPEHDVHYLSDEECTEVSIGDPWRDAFLLRGEFHFGTTAELKAKIDDEGGLGPGFPLTALDLVSNNAGNSRKKALSAAYDFVAGKAGYKNAQRWLVESYLRGQLLVLLRQNLRVQNASIAALETIRHLSVVLHEDRDTIAINLLHLPEGLDSQELIQVKVLENDKTVAALLSELPPSLAKLKLKVNLGESSLAKPYVPKPVLIVPYGPDAERLARHFQNRRPDQGFVVDRNWPSQMFEVWQDDVIGRLNSKNLSGYSIVVALVCERSDKLKANPYLSALEELLQRKDAPELIVAPILPLDRPSQHLNLDHQAPLFESILGQTLLDTSFVRSPDWVGDHTKSLSRRLSDHIEKACLALLSKPEILHRFSERKKRQRQSLLCVYPSKLSKHTKSDLDYLSEAAAFSSSSERHIARAFLEQIHPARYKRKSETGKYDVALRPMDQSNFQALAAQAWSMVVKRPGPPIEVNPVGGDTDILRRIISYPLATSDLLLFDEPLKQRFLLTAEAPNLELVRFAENTGRQAVRYTDKFSLRRFSNTNRARLWDFELPDDFQSPKRLSEAGNPNVFRRAHDCDSQVLLAEAWKRWLARYPNHPLRSSGKLVLPTGVRTSKSVPTLVAISERELERAARTDDRGAEELSKLFIPPGSQRVTDILIEPTRQHALNADISRWVFREGRYPIVPRKLPEWLTVPRGWIAFDGDIYAAALVASGLLETWMKSHSSKGSGWGRRPVHQSILDAFPWPDVFQIEGLPGAVYCSEPSPRFADAAQSLPLRELTEDFEDPSQIELEAEIEFPIRQLLLAETLHLYGLPGLRNEGEALESLRDHADRFLGRFATTPFGRLTDLA